MLLCICSCFHTAAIVYTSTAIDTDCAELHGICVTYKWYHVNTTFEGSFKHMLYKASTSCSRIESRFGVAHYIVMCACEFPRLFTASHKAAVALQNSVLLLPNFAVSLPQIWHHSNTSGCAKIRSQ